VMAVILMAVFTAVNFVGIKWLAHTNSTIMWWKLAIPLLAIIILLTKWHSGNFNVGGFAPYGAKGFFGAIVGAGIVFSLLGFEQADQLAGEIKNPQKNLPRAIIGAMLIAIAVYTLLQLAFLAALPHSSLAHGFAGLAGNTTLAAGPFAGLAGLIALGWLAVILRIDAFISPFGTGLIYTTSTSRVSYGLGRNRYYPQIFQRTDKRGVPWFGLIVTFIFGVIFLLPFPSWHALVGLVTGASVLMYAGAPLALGAFRKQVPEATRPYRMGGAAIFSPLAFIFASLIVYWSGFETIWKLGLCIVIGYVLIGISMMFDPQRPPLDWKSAQWLPFYLIGMGILSWQGQYSGGAVKSPVNTGNIPLWWDIVAVAGFSLIIYFWAQAVRLPREEMLLLVEKQSGTEELPAV
jgi:amino acid transporter